MAEWKAGSGEGRVGARAVARVALAWTLAAFGAFPAASVAQGSLGSGTLLIAGTTLSLIHI